MNVFFGLRTKHEKGENQLTYNYYFSLEQHTRAYYYNKSTLLFKYEQLTLLTFLLKNNTNIFKI